MTFSNTVLIIVFVVCVMFLSGCDHAAWEAPKHDVKDVASETTQVTIPETGFIAGDCWFPAPEGQFVECGFYYPDNFPGARLPVVILRHNPQLKTDQALIYLPGGPGSASYIDEDGINYWKNWYAESGLAIDLVLVDRRGTGLARPVWNCPKYNQFARDILLQNVSLKEENEAALGILNDCIVALQQKGFSSQYFSTRFSADDVAGILAAAGYSQWHIYGVSYGTRLALSIYEYYPEQVASLILDSFYTPQQGQASDWPEMLDSAFKRYWQACKQYSDCKTPEEFGAKFWKVLNRLKQVPVTITVPSWYGEPPFRVVVNDQRLLAILFSSLYDRYLYRDIATALTELQRYRTAALARLAETFVNSAFDPMFNDWVYYAVECRDNSVISAEVYAQAVERFPEWKAYTAEIQQDVVCESLNATNEQVPFSLAKGEEVVRENGLANNQVNRQVNNQVDKQVYNGVANQIDSEVDSQLNNQAKLSDVVFPAVTVPTLILGGELDPITPADAAKKTLPYFSQGQGIFLEGYGHAIESSLPCGPKLVADFVSNPDAKVSVSCAGNVP